MTSFEYKQCHQTSYHIAILEKGGKEVARSRNRIGSRSRGCGWSDQTLHAERAVVKALGDISQLRGCVLIVMRINKNNEIVCSEPCNDCKKFLTKCMNCYGLRKVLYSNQGAEKCAKNISNRDSSSCQNTSTHIRWNSS